MNTPPTDGPRKRPWDDADLIRTNPVLVADLLYEELKPHFRNDIYRGTARAPALFAGALALLARKGGCVPDAALDAHRAAGALPVGFHLPPHDHRPGVLGLAVDDRATDPAARVGFVVPLAPEPLPFGADWHIDSSLPFPSGDVLNLLVRLMHAGVPDARGVPERLAYRFANPLGRSVRGNSMTVTAALAVIDHLGGRTEARLRAAITLVEPGTDGGLEPVGFVREKVSAALREHVRLALVVAPRNCPELDEFPGDRLGVVWRVRTVEELAGHLARSGLLAPLIAVAAAPLGRVELLRIQTRLRWLLDHEYRYEAAAELADRVRGCEKATPLYPGALIEVGRLSGAAYEHHGRFADAVAVGSDTHAGVRALGPLATDDEEADAAADYAAGLYDAHEFDRIPPLLEGWAVAAERDPRRFRAGTRVNVWGTLGRARVVLGPDGWQKWFALSLDMHRAFGDPVSARRTATYLINGYLRHGDAENAARELAQIGEGLDRDPTDIWAGCRSAYYARVVGLRWDHAAFDAARPADALAVPKQAFGFYLQATARQPGRAPNDASERLLRAAEFLRAEAGGAKRNVCVLFALFLELSAAGQTGDPATWADRKARIAEFLADPAATALRSYYAPATLPDDPCPIAAEALLRLVPYF